MTYMPNSGGGVELSSNSTTTALSASATYTGTSQDISAYSQVTIIIYGRPGTVAGDGSDAKASFYFDFSPDGTNWDISVPHFIRDPSLIIPVPVINVAKYFRVRYINDGGTSAIAALGLSEAAGTPTTQTEFRLTTYGFINATKELTRTMDQGISGSDPVSLTRSALMGRKPNDDIVNVRLNNAGNILSSDFGMEAAKGDITGHSIINKFGRNDALSTTIEDIAILGGVYSWRTSAVALEAISTSANDTSGGSGARTVYVEGLDSSFNVVNETITMNGTSASTATTQTFIRFHFAYVLTSGGSYPTTTSGTQAGTITIRASGGGSNEFIINRPTIGTATPTGQGQLGRYTIPNGFNGYLLDAELVGDASKNTSFILWQRQNADTVSAPFTAKRILFRADDLTSPFHYMPLVPRGPFPEKTDLWWSGFVSSGSGEGSVAFQILLEDNTLND